MIEVTKEERRFVGVWFQLYKTALLAVASTHTQMSPDTYIADKAFTLADAAFLKLKEYGAHGG